MIDPQNATPSIVDFVLSPWIIECAWCLQERGRDMGNGSHSICTAHAAVVRAESKARNAVRLAQKQPRDTQE